MPTFADKPFYPHGMPILPQHLSYNGKTLWQLFLLQCEDKAAEEDIDVLKEYIMYYVNAPGFIVPEKLKKKDPKKISLDDLINECIDIGIDPF